jgi:MoxR-like ATPase
VLIDEIDKAPRDFPNDLLNVLDQHEIEFPHVSRAECPPLKPKGPAPLVIITSNSERRLPEPFLRRCVFHHIKLTPDLLDQVVAAHRADFAGLAEPVLAAARERFLELRLRQDLRKVPSSGEFLAWAKALQLLGITERATLEKPRLADLPALAVLVKDSEDLEALRSR